MSFFIRPQNSIKQNVKILEKKNKGKGKRKIAPPPNSKKKKQKKINDEDIESDEEEQPAGDVPTVNGDYAAYESDDNYETAQEKKLRLAKVYLDEIERREKRLKEKEEVEKDDITRHLKDDLREKANKIRKAVADSYSGYDEVNVRMLRCKDHHLPLTCVVISSDNKFIYSASKDPSIVRWEFESGQKLKSIKDRKDAKGSKVSLGKVLCLAISSDSKFLVSGHSNNEVNVWKPDTLEHLHTFFGHKGAVTGVVFQKNHHTLYSASADKSVKVWNLTEMAYVESLFGHQKGLTAIDALQAERAITSGEDNSVHLWKIIEESQLIFNANGGVEGLKFINDEIFISCGSDGTLCCWGVLKKRPLFIVKDAHGIDEVNLQSNWLTSVATLMNTDLVASGSYNGAIKLWKCSDNFRKLVSIFDISVKGFVNSLQFSSDGNFLVAAVGSEHRLGRWWRLKEVKSHILVIPLKNSC